MDIGALIDAVPAGCGYLRQFDRVNVGAKMMTRYAEFGFDAQNVFSRYALGALHPFRNCGLPDATHSSQSSLRPGDFYRLLKGFVFGWGVGHDAFYSNWNNSVKCISKVSHYSVRNI